MGKEQLIYDKRKAMEARATAEFVLNKYWNVSDKFPVDPVYIANQFNIEVYATEKLPDGISGAIIKKEDRDAIILVDKNDKGTPRGRFTVAHELGHFMFRENIGKNEFTYVDLRSELSSQGVDEEEKFANRFAANLLVPENEVRKSYDQNSPSEWNILSLSSYFKVSNEMMRYRLQSLGLLGLS